MKCSGSGTEVSIIIHNGAVVHWGRSYAHLEAANVISTALLLRLATTHGIARFFYVTGGQPSIFKDEEETAVAQQYSSTDEGIIGYAQIKFVAEALVRRAARRHHHHDDQPSESPRFSMVSPGLVIGTPTEGVANADDYLWRLTAACIKIGVYDGDEANTSFNIADVGTVARTIIGAALGSNNFQHRQHYSAVEQIEGRMKWGQFWMVLRDMGYSLEPRASSGWLSLVLEDLDREREDHPLWPVAHMLQGEYSPRGGDDGSSGQDINKRNGDDGMGSNNVLDLRKAVMKSAEFLARLGHLPLSKDMVKNTEVEGLAEVETDTGAFSRSGL